MQGSALPNPPAVTERCDAVVLGAGISGLVSASVLLEQGCERVIIVDEYPHIGGNHIDWSSDGYTFDIGSIIFQDDSPLLKHFPELLEHYVRIDPSWSRLTPQGIVTAYPISVRDDILAAGPIEISKILASVLYARIFRRKMRNAKEFAQFWIGDRLLQRSGLDSYMTRFYGVSSDQIDIELARKRMLWISEHSSLRSLLARLVKRKQPPPTNRQLARPREGYGHLYAVAAARLAIRGASIVTHARMLRLEKRDGHFCLALDDKVILAERVISTIPLMRIEALCNLPISDKLETITLLTLYFSFSGERGFGEAILYNFSHKGAWKRLTVYSDFYGRRGDREYFAVEVIANHIQGSVVKAEKDFRDHVAANGLFAGDLKLEGSHFLENAYPIYKGRADQKAAKAIQALRAMGIESFGRQGGFNYQPTARVSTLEAEAALRRTSGL
ncbi:NAD(P)-binding protein [Bosea sp. 2YAB26]|uniref:FAD-dependent oxidoreductase n=1 Tax=Bosea sp. 2YAB26 TaxID=3237478 RepID=UPI003F8E58DA